MVGQTISHYKILEKLGEGGMGVVYKAQDLKLDRLVAMKFLPPEFSRDAAAKQRFIHEAKAASALDHPNICNVHEIGETTDGQIFIVMAAYEGTTLDNKIKVGPLKLDEVHDIAIQVAEGLQAAHKKGIFHRDIKSSNVIITDEGQVKIMDFGLARTTGATKLTKSGATIGTVPYMSPEQARGEKVDHRTDIWSIGVVIYEMITGRLPFKSEYNEAIVYSILNENPPPLTSLRSDVPMELERIVNKAIQKNASERYQRMDEILVDLNSLKRGVESGKSKQQLKKPVTLLKKRVYLYGGIAALLALSIGGGLYLSQLVKKEKAESPSQAEKIQPASEIKRTNSIAVLPFKNISSDKEQEYFCDGMTEQIITNLSNLRDLKVIARTSVMQFKNSEKPIPEIGKQLGVANVLEGSIRKAGNRIRITAQLIKADDGFHLWSKDYDRELKDIFAVQDDVSKAIVAALKINLTPPEEARLMSMRRVDERAYDFYLKGLFHYNTFTQDGLKKAISLYEQSVQIDSTYAPAYAGLANSYNVMGAFGMMPWPQSMEKAKLATHKALELDGTLAEAHVSLAIISGLEWNWSQAEREWKRAHELSPGSILAPEWYLTHLHNLGKFDEYMVAAKRWEALEPLSLNARAFVGASYLASGRYAEAMEKIQAVLELDPNHNVATHLLGLTYLAMAKYDEAIAALKKALALYGKDSQWQKAFLGLTYARAGHTEHALELIDEMKKSYSTRGNVSPWVIALLYVGLGDEEEAMQWFNRAFDARDPMLPGAMRQMGMLPGHLRDDPRFTALLKKIGLEP